MMIMQNAAVISNQDSSYLLSDELSSHNVVEENEYENIEIIRSCHKTLIPVPSPYRNIEFSNPKAPNPTPCPRPTSTAGCFFTPGGKSQNHPNLQDQFDPSLARNFHCRTHSDSVKEDTHFRRPLFFSPQPQKTDLPPAMSPQGQRKLRQSVKRAVSDGHAQIKTTRNRERKSFTERNKCLAESGPNTKNRRG